MSDAPDPPEPSAPHSAPRRGASFLASFAASVAFPLLGLASSSVGLLFFSVAFWALGVVVGLVMAVAGGVRKNAAQRSAGLGILSGTLVGAIVGFSLCAGLMGPLDMR